MKDEFEQAVKEGGKVLKRRLVEVDKNGPSLLMGCYAEIWEYTVRRKDGKVVTARVAKMVPADKGVRS